MGFINNIIVCGGRSYDNKDMVYSTLNQLHERCDFTLFQGGAKGADALAKEWAIERGVPYRQFDALWWKYGKSAGFRRNKDMIDAGATHVVAFKGGNGTENMLEQAEEHELNILVVDHERP